MLRSQSKQGFCDFRNKSVTHLWKLLTGPPNDPPIDPLLATRSLYKGLKVENFRKFLDLGNFDDHWCHPVNTTRDTHLKLEKCQILVCRQGGAPPPPTSPINPYLVERAHKNSATLLMQSHFSIFPKPHFWAKNDS